MAEAIEEDGYQDSFKIKSESTNCGTNQEPDLSSIITRTLCDLQEMKGKYEDGINIIYHILDSIEVKNDLSIGMELINSGLRMHSSLLEYLTSICQLVGSSDKQQKSASTPKNKVEQIFVVKNETSESGAVGGVDDDQDEVKEDVTIKVEPDSYDLQEDHAADFDEDEDDEAAEQHLQDVKQLGDLRNDDSDCEDWISKKVAKLSDGGESDEEGIKEHAEGNNCKICKKGYADWRTLRRHILIVHLKRIKCDKCGRAFACKGDLRSHEKSNHELTEKVQCDLCGKSFTTLDSLKQHRRRHNAAKPPRKKCDHCDETFKRKDTLANHMRKHFKTEEELAEETKMKKKGPPSVCPICGKSFKHSCNLQTHMKVHKESGRFKCDKCPAEFKYKNGLNKHFQIFHTTNSKNESYICSFCAKDFANEYKLKYHMYQCPMQEKKIPCDQCDKTFLTMAKLKTHMISHSDERPFKCDQCDQAFKEEKRLARHLFLHSGEKPFQCDRCDKAFPFKKYLENHYRVHTGEKPYECKFCGKDFSLQSDMYKHIRKLHK